MRIGMLWYFEKNKKKKDNLEKAILEAAEYYHKKYGYVPDRCYINSLEEGTAEKVIYEENNISIVKNKSILPNHLWIGTEEEKDLKGE